MHECPNCGQACACDGEDLWHDDYEGCECDCENDDSDDADPGDMDGDHETGLRDAGFGTDEDYGWCRDCDD